MLFFQIYRTFQRFDCKVFLTNALPYLGVVVERVMSDNTHVIVLRSTGRVMLAVPDGLQSLMCAKPRIRFLLEAGLPLDEVQKFLRHERSLPPRVTPKRAFAAWARTTFAPSAASG